MSRFPSPTLTGSESGAPPTHLEPVSIALGRLRTGVRLCCWAIGLSLVVETIVFGLVTFTDMRWGEVARPAAGGLVVQAEPKSVHVRSALDEVPEDPPAPVDPNRGLTSSDRIFATLAALARGMGTLAVLALMPLLAVGVLLAAASATLGVDRVVSAFSWSVIVALLALPLGALVGLPWREGAFWSYAGLVEHVDHAGGALWSFAGGRDSGFVFLARHLLMPLASIGAVTMTALRFSDGVRAGLMRKENLALDPALEAETANIQPASLHGSRTAGAMRAAMSGDSAPPAPAPPPTAVKTISPGAPAPRRLI